MSKPKCMFSYYGSKSKSANRYPEPLHDKIVEPFAGGASYSLRHFEKDVTLCDLNEKVADIWEFLLGNEPSDVISSFPRSVRVGDKISELLGPSADPGLVALCQSQANMGTMGSKGNHDQVTKFGAMHWHQAIKRIEYYLPRVRHWSFVRGSYESLENTEATWFIDPPYANEAGGRYMCSSVDYSELAEWCKSRRGQVIVCENVGANWLPFEPFGKGRPRGGVRVAMEAIWTNS